MSLLAPGDRIYSTYLDNGFTFLSGTSMATPHVSGVSFLRILIIEFVLRPSSEESPVQC